MALTASDNAGERAPISRHRAFPAIVALWFAALLGLGSMVVPAALLERGVAMTGIAAYVPAASPPLGMTARAIIALAAALVGALVGIAIARRVAGAHGGESDDNGDSVWAEARLANGARRPLDVTTEIGESLSAGFGQPVARRRALAIAEDERPSDEVPEPVPAYGEPPYARETTDAEFEPYQPVDDPLDAAEEPETAYPAEAPMRLVHDVEPLPLEADTAAQEELAPVPSEPEPEPLAFAAPSLARGTIETAADAPVPKREEPPRVAPAQEQGEPELVQLVQRLKTSLERRREQAGAPATAPAPAPAVAFEPAPADDAAQAMAAYFGRPAHAAPPVADAHDEDDDEPDEFDGSYSSLLAMRGPHMPRDNARVPIELPKVEVEVDAEPIEPEIAIEVEPVEPLVEVDTDVALRAALAKLQRMSGAA